MKLTKSIIVIAIFMLNTCPVAVAQEDPLNDAMVVGQPSKQHEMLESLVGKWDVKVQFKINDKWHEGTSQCVSKMILGGRFLKQTYESKMFDQPFSVEQTLGYDNVAKQFIEIHMNNMNTGIDVRRGNTSKDGKSIEFEGENIDPITNKNQRIRTVLTVTDEDNFAIDWYQTIGESKEQKTVTLSHVRKKKE